MKSATTWPLAAGLLLVAATSPAQAAQADASSAKSIDAQIDLMRKDLRDARKQIVAANMSLTGDEAAKFWPVYEAYTQEMMKVNDVRVGVVKEYAANYGTLTDSQASDYVHRWSGSDEAQTKLRSQWFGKFEKAVGAKKAAVFFQIDRRLSLIMELQLSAQLPLAEP
jgi:hypothetical protein